MKSIFESYLEVDNDVWSAHRCSSVESDNFVSDDIFVQVTVWYRNRRRM